MRTLLFLMALILLLVLSGLIAVRGAVTSTTDLTLAAGNMVRQATILLLACAFVGMMLVGLPAILYLAFRLGKVTANHPEPINPMDARPLIVTLPPPEIPATAVPEPSTRTLAKPRLRRRVRGSVHQAAYMARRWFQ